MELTKHILLVMKWIDDPKSVSRDELIENRRSAVAYITCTAAAAAAAAAAADAAADDAAAAAADAAAANAEYWVNKYFERTGENKQDYSDAIEAGKKPQEPESKEWVGGLPPIGCEVLLDDDEENYLFSAANNEKVRIVADEVLVVVSIGARHDNGNHVVTVMAKDCKNIRGYTTVITELLSPLKTQEQKDREAFIEWGKKGLSYRLEEESFAIRILEQLADNGAKAPEGE